MRLFCNKSRSRRLIWVRSNVSRPFCSLPPRLPLLLMSQAFPDKVSIMRIRIVFVGATFVFVSVIPLRAADSAAQSQADRLRNLEQAVQQLQQRNAGLEGEVKQLKAKSGPFAPILSTPGGKATAGNENKAVFTAPSPPPVYVVPGGAEYKLTLGGYLQMNAEGGDVSAFEGRFGLSALKDRFRIRRARVNLIGDFAEQFD